jgi:hypothetical protein
MAVQVHGYRLFSFGKNAEPRFYRRRTKLVLYFVNRLIGDYLSVVS